MSDEVTYRSTEKGKAALSGSGRVSPSVRRLLELIGKRTTHAQLSAGMPEVPDAKLREAVERLASRGYVNIAGGAAPELNLTRYFINQPVRPPTIERRRQAEKQTISGMRALKRAGYFVSILSRPDRRIAPRSGDKYRVLILDSEEANTLFVTRTLLLAGFDAHVAVTRTEILDALNHQSPADVIAMDVVLPDVVGLDLLGRLHQHPAYKAVPIIVMASKAGRDDVVAALAYGASGYMTKPFKPEALLQSVNAVLGLG